VKMAFKVFNNRDEVLGSCPEAPPPTPRWAGQQRTPLGPASSATRWDTGQKTALPNTTR
jgi:hypothetical protein